jgi:hypothetical protein
MGLPLLMINFERHPNPGNALLIIFQISIKMFFSLSLFSRPSLVTLAAIWQSLKLDGGGGGRAPISPISSRKQSQRRRGTAWLPQTWLT